MSVGVSWHLLSLVGILNCLAQSLRSPSSSSTLYPCELSSQQWFQTSAASRLASLLFVLVPLIHFGLIVQKTVENIKFALILADFINLQYNQLEVAETFLIGQT